VSSERSGDLLPPSPPAEKATDSKDQAGQSCTGRARFRVFTTGRPCLILLLAGSEFVVSVPIEADIDAEIGARLAEVRRHCGLTQRQLAKAVGVTITTIQNWERGRLAISAKRLAALANALHCQPLDLLMLPGAEDVPRGAPLGAADTG